jgi:hypothetical protein
MQSTTTNYDVQTTVSTHVSRIPPHVPYGPWNDSSIYKFPLSPMHPFITFIHKWAILNCIDTILCKPYVINWIVGDTSFITGTSRAQRKECEDRWGMSLFNNKSKMWSGKLGECITRTLLYILDGHATTCDDEAFTITSQPRIANMRLDVMTPLRICEVKTGSWYTTGTACEKIFGSVYKHSDVPRLSKKPLYIISIASSDLYARHNGLVNTPPIPRMISTSRHRLIDTCTQLNITFYSGYQLLIDAIIRSITNNPSSRMGTLSK